MSINRNSSDDNLSLRPDNQSLIIMTILFITLVLGIIFLSKGYVRKSRDK